MTAFSFELVTPERVLWSGSASAVSMRTDVGEVTFLANHSPLVGALDVTVLKIEVSDEEPSAGSDAGSTDQQGTGSSTSAGSEVLAAVHGGFVLVDSNKVVLASGVAEMGDEIDVARARRALESATERLASEPTEVAPAADDDHGSTPATSTKAASAAFLDPRSAEAALRRAKVRLAAAGQAIEQVA